MKSLEFFKPTLATTLTVVLAWLLSVRPAQAGYIVTLQQVGPDVVATGSGAIDLTGLTFLSLLTLPDVPEPGIQPSASFLPFGANASIVTGPTPTTMVDSYLNSADLSGPAIFGGGSYTSASSGSGDMVGIFREPRYNWDTVIVPTGYVSGYCSIGQRDLQRRESCNPRRNTRHLRMEVGNRSEPELHASNKNTGAGKHGDLVLEQQCFCRRQLRSHSSGRLDSSWCGGP